MVEAEKTSSRVASLGFLHTRLLAAVPVGEGEQFLERPGLAEGEVAVMEAIVIVAEEKGELAAAAQVCIVVVDPYSAEQIPVFAQLDMQDAPGR